MEMPDNKVDSDRSASEKTRIADVANRANVSPATVSRVLNNPSIVRPELRTKVLQAIAELSYTLDSAARALKSRRTGTIGIVVPTLNISIFAEGVEALQNRLREHGYTLLISNAQYDSEREMQDVQILLERGVDGLVLVGDSHRPELYARIRKSGVPFVTTYVSMASEGVPAVGIDNERATYDMARYLLTLGHRDFGLIANVPSANDRSRARLDGALRALRDAGITLEDDRIIKADHSLAQGRYGLRRLIESCPEITAIICTTDTLAIGALTEARAIGLNVPKALSITGFDDIELSAQIEPALTTVSVPAAEIARAAADHLINALAGLPIPEVTPMPYRLIMRGSTGAPRGIRSAPR